MASSIVDDKKTPIRLQLEALKAASIETGILHQAQIDQLRMWGLVAFQFVPIEGVECQVDQEGHDVHYVLKGGRLFRKWNFFHKEKCDFNWLVGVIAALDGSVKDLLGPHWRLLITHNGKLEYEGPREKTPEQMKHERDEYRRERNREIKR